MRGFVWSWFQKQNYKKQRPEVWGAGLNFKRVKKLDGLGLEALIGTQIAPLPRRQLPQLDAPNADALEADHLKAHLFAHAANLALFAFGQHKAKLLWVLPFNLCALQGLSV
jgi:hypothetical protein